MTLTRKPGVLYGVFGVLLDDNNTQIAVTLEHAYSNGQGGFQPKIPDGTYTCQRGTHILSGMSNTFETFEIQNVPGHTGILFHWGNYNNDSEGCVLLGTDLGTCMITDSRDAFARFMNLMEGVDTFSLRVDSI